MAGQHKKVLVVTHDFPVKNSTVQNPPPIWEYLNVFLESAENGRLVLKYHNMKYSISGHVHHR